MDQNFPLVDAADHLIIMTCAAHFNGDYDKMLDYYLEERKGINPEIFPKRIAMIQKLQHGSAISLADDLLGNSEQEEVSRSKALYNYWKGVIKDRDEDPIKKAYAALLLSEEEEPQAEIELLSSFGEEAVDFILEKLGEEEPFDPILPGYGFVPVHLLQALGEIRSEKGLGTVYFFIDHEHPEIEEAALQAFTLHGESAKAFLKKRLEGKLYHLDLRKAAFAASLFSPDEAMGTLCLTALNTPEWHRDQELMGQLIGAVAHHSPSRLKELKEMANQFSFSPAIKEQITFLLKYSH